MDPTKPTVVDLEMRYRRVSYAILSLAERWLPQDGYGDQSQVDPAAIAALDADAPSDIEAFRAYCVMHADKGELLDADDLKTIREFIRQAAKAGVGVLLSP